MPVTLLELTFGVLGDPFGRKRLLIIGAATMAVGELVSALTPGSGSSTDTRVVVLWGGQILSGIGAAFQALDHAYSTGYIVCGSAATLSVVLAVVALGGRRSIRKAGGRSKPPPRLRRRVRAECVGLGLREQPGAHSRTQARSAGAAPTPDGVGCAVPIQEVS